MANLTSELLVRLNEQVSGPAAKAAAGLGSIEKAAGKLGKTKGLSDGLYRELEKIKATPAQFRQIENAYVSFKRRVESLGPIKAEHWIRLHKDWHAGALAQIRGMRREYEGLGKAAAGAIAVVAGSYAVRRGVRASLKAGADNMREDSRDYLGGLSTLDSVALRAGAARMSGQYRSIDFASAHERLRDTAQSMGSVDKALALGDTIGAGNAVLQSLKGPEKALEESRKFFKALDTLGKNVDPAEVRSLYDGYIKALGVEGADMNMGDIFTLVKRAKSGGASLSNEFLMAIAPSLMQDMGPDRVGTAIGSMVSQIVGGRATKKSKESQREFGLRGKDGKVLRQDLMLSNPFEYAKQVLGPALAAKGVDLADNGAVVAAVSRLFSNQMVADLFTKLLTQMEQYERKAAQYGKGPGLDAANSLGARDPYVAFESVNAQLRNLGGSIADHVMSPLTSGMNGLSTVINSFAEAAKGGASAGALLVTGLGGLAAAMAVGGTVLKSVLPGVFGSAAGGAGAAGGAVGAVAAGGALASVVANEVVKGNKEAFKDVATNPMLGAMGGDYGLASAIHNAPEIAAEIAEMQRRAAEEAARRKLEAPPADASGKGPFDHSAAFVHNSAVGFREGLSTELQEAEREVAESVRRMRDMLNFNASPQITPQINAPAGVPGKQSSISGVSRQLARRIDSRATGNFADLEYG